MSRARCKFTQADVTKAVKGARAAGVEIREVVVDASGAIRLIVGSPPTSPNEATANPWDAELAHDVH